MEEKNNTNQAVVESKHAAVEQPVVVETKVKKEMPKALLISLIILGLAVSGVAGYYAGRIVKENKYSINNDATPTPTPSMTDTPTITPIVSETTVPTVTATATPMPTVSKSAKMKEFEGNFTLKFTFNVPNDVTVTEGKVGSWNGIVFKKGTKNFMAFNLPYELYEMQGYSTITPVSSVSIASLERVRAKKVFENSGSYSLAVAYVTPTSLASGTECTEPVVANKTTSPCALPAVRYSDDIGFGAYCSIDPTYIEICDAVMKDLKVVKE
ncbi:hypothetical protein IT418_04000 [bacterium]|nr:hypothetical protein [bacterium]